MPNKVDSHQQKWTPHVLTGSKNGKNGDGRVLPRVLLDDGQGKSPSDMDISSDESAADQPAEGGLETDTMEHILLRPPMIEAMGGIATGASTPALRKQNKAHWISTLLSQPTGSQWTVHSGHTFLPEKHWDLQNNDVENREMNPQGLAHRHETPKSCPIGHSSAVPRAQGGIGPCRKLRRQSRCTS